MTIPEWIISAVALHAVEMLMDWLTRGKTESDRGPGEVLRQELSLIDEVRTKLAQPTSENAPDSLAVGCLPCARAHLATIAGTLKEAIRFARSEGLNHPEVQSRLEAAEEDVTIVERHDWTPEKILRSPEHEQKLIRAMLPKLRELRQEIIDIDSVEDLEEVAAKAATLSVELRLAVLSLKGIDTEKIKEIAQKVQTNELTLDDGKKQVRDLVAQCPICATEETR